MEYLSRCTHESSFVKPDAAPTGVRLQVSSSNDFLWPFNFATENLCKPAPGTTHATVALGNLDIFAELFARVESNNWKNN